MKKSFSVTLHSFRKKTLKGLLFAVAMGAVLLTLPCCNATTDDNTNTENTTTTTGTTKYYIFTTDETSDTIVITVTDKKITAVTINGEEAAVKENDDGTVTFSISGDEDAIVYTAGTTEYGMIDKTNVTANENDEIKTVTVENWLENTAIVQAIKDLCFTVTCVDIEPEDGLYTPDTGDLIDLKYEQKGDNIIYNIHMYLDREYSTADNLVYKGTVINTNDNTEYDANDLLGTMEVDKKNYSINITMMIINRISK